MKKTLLKFLDYAPYIFGGLAGWVIVRDWRLSLDLISIMLSLTVLKITIKLAEEIERK